MVFPWPAPRGPMTRRIGLILFLLLLPLARESAAAAPIDCSDAGKRLWSRSDPQVNLSHIFCGELGRNGDPKGYHSRAVPLADRRGRPGGRDRASRRRHLRRLGDLQQRPAQAVDLLSRRLPGRGDPALRPLRLRPPDRGASRLGRARPSAPDGAAGQSDGYCRDENGRAFEIRIGTIQRRGQDAINTAFPN